MVNGIEKMRNRCVLWFSIAYPPLQEFCNNPKLTTHNIHTRVRPHYLLPTIPNTQSISKQFAQCDRFCNSQNPLGLVLGTSDFSLISLWDFTCIIRSCKLSIDASEMTSVGASTSFKKSWAIDTHPCHAWRNWRGCAQCELNFNFQNFLDLLLVTPSLTSSNLWNLTRTKRNVETNFGTDIVSASTSLKKSWAIGTHRSNACRIGGRMLDWMWALSTPNVK